MSKRTTGACPLSDPFREGINSDTHFIDIAYGSLLETYSELLTAADLGYITEQEVLRIKPQFVDVGKMLSGLRQSLLHNDNR